MNPTSASAAPASAPTIVDNIPVRSPGAEPAHSNEDTELDKIMHDVGKELKKDDKKPKKHGFLHFGRKTKKDAPFTAQVIKQAPATPNTQPAPMSVAAAPVPVSQPVAPAPQAALHPSVKSKPVAAAAVKPKKQTSVPVFVIFVTVLATGFLIAAAIAAYRQQ